MHDQHGLPEKWHEMSYDKFLIERRKLMAAIIRRGFESLSPNVSIAAANSSTALVTTPEETESWKAALSSPVLVTQSGSLNGNGEDIDGDEPARYELRRRYWGAFRDHLIAKGSALKSPQPSADMQFRFPRLATGVRPWAWMSLRHGSVDVGVTFRGEVGLKQFAGVRALGAMLEQELGGELYWEERPESGWAYFELSKMSDPADEASWTSQHAWLQEKLELIYRLLPPHLTENTSA